MEATVSKSQKPKKPPAEAKLAEQSRRHALKIAIDPVLYRDYQRDYWSM